MGDKTGMPGKDLIPDSHAHLDLMKGDVTDVLSRAREAGVGPILSVGINHESNLAAIRMAKEHTSVKASVGVHPNDTADWSEKELEKLESVALSSAQVVALGETGLDYYRKRSPKDKQKEAFHAHLRLAKELELPVIVHDREAHEDVMEILEEEAVGAVVVLHCFSGGREMLSECIGRGYYISFAGPLTYKKSDELREKAKMVPEELLLVETDCPFLTPEPHRGKPNQPAYARFTAETLAGIRDQTIEGLAGILTENFDRLFVTDKG